MEQWGFNGRTVTYLVTDGDSSSTTCKRDGRNESHGVGLDGLWEVKALRRRGEVNKEKWLRAHLGSSQLTLMLLATKKYLLYFALQ